MEQVEKFKQMVDEAYEDYTNYPLATIQDYRTNILYQNKDKGWCKRNGRSVVSPHPTRHLTKDEFVNKCKNDSEFSQKWGLKIEERELTDKERLNTLIQNEQRLIYEKVQSFKNLGRKTIKSCLDEKNIPTKLITITYKENKIETYE